MSAPVDRSSSRPRRCAGLLVVLATGLLAGACSSTSSIDSFNNMLAGSPPPEDPAMITGSASPVAAAAAPKTELDKAIAYWGGEYNKKPTDLKVALAYAKNLKAAGYKEQAFGVLQAASMMHGDSKELANELGRMALEYDQVALAEKLLAMADDPMKPDWRVMSARGTVLAKQNKFTEAIPLFERALAAAPGRPSVLNNLAMAYAANGDAAKAEQLLRKAVAGSNDPKIKQNLALVLGLEGRHDEAQSMRVSSGAQSTAAADTEFIKRMVKATPATTPAVTPAVMTNARPSAPRAPVRQRGVIEAKATGTQPSGAGGLRPADGPNAVGSPTGAWSTSVSAAQ